VSTPLFDASPAGSRAHDVLRVLRRTGVAHEAVEDTVSRLLDEVHPSQDDLLAALSDAMSMADSDPAKTRLIALLNATLRTGRFRAV
jgi:hypothetical protein